MYVPPRSQRGSARGPTHTCSTTDRSSSSLMLFVPSLKPIRLRGVSCAWRRGRRPAEAELRPAHDDDAASDPGEVAHRVEGDLRVVRACLDGRDRRRSAPGRGSSPGNAGSSASAAGLALRETEAIRTAHGPSPNVTVRAPPGRARAPRPCRLAVQVSMRSRPRRARPGDIRAEASVQARREVAQLGARPSGRRRKRRSGACPEPPTRFRPGAHRRKGPSSPAGHCLPRRVAQARRRRVPAPAPTAPAASSRPRVMPRLTAYRPPRRSTPPADSGLGERVDRLRLSARMFAAVQGLVAYERRSAAERSKHVVDVGELGPDPRHERPIGDQRGDRIERCSRSVDVRLEVDEIEVRVALLLALIFDFETSPSSSTEPLAICAGSSSIERTLRWSSATSFPEPDGQAAGACRRALHPQFLLDRMKAGPLRGRDVTGTRRRSPGRGRRSSRQPARCARTGRGPRRTPSVRRRGLRSEAP